MLLAILLITIFNTGLILLGLGGIVMCKEDVLKGINLAAKHTDESIESATTAIFNMDSLKQKASMQEDKWTEI